MADKDSDLGDGANQNQGDSDGSNVNAELETLLKGFGERLDVMESQQKALQGDKDRGVNKALKDTQELKEGFAEFKEYTEKYGDDAESRFEQDLAIQRLSKLADTLEAAQQETDKASQALDADKVSPELLEKHGIDPQSPEYLAQVKAGLTGLDLALAVASGAKPLERKEGDATGASGGAGGSGTTSAAQQNLQAQFDKELDKQDFWTPIALHNLEEEYRKKGMLLD